MADGHELAMRLRTAYLALHRRTNAELARFGMTADQFVLLTVLAGGDALTQKALVERSGSDPNTMSERLRRLERLGLIARERHATDGRARSVALTAAGRRMQPRLWNASDALRGLLENALPSGALDDMVAQLDRVSGAMGASETGRPGDDHLHPRASLARRALGKAMKR